MNEINTVNKNMLHSQRTGTRMAVRLKITCVRDVCTIRSCKNNLFSSMQYENNHVQKMMDVAFESFSKLHRNVGRIYKKKKKNQEKLMQTLD